jgi:Uma2 family endonuclease
MNEKALNQPDKKLSSDEYSRGGDRNKPAANRWHNLIGTNICVATGSRLQGHKCEIYVNDMRVQMKNNRICYPDVVIVNNEPVFTDQNFDVLLNPTVAVEIFSTSTNSSNKTNKLENYLAMDSIRECLLVKEDEMRVEHYAKQNAKQWIYRIYNERDDVISLDSINIKLSLSEIYAQIKFRQAEISSRAVN